MANWFKLYETDLDETRMRFALTKLPEVWPVWTGVLMECCKHGSDSFSWSDSEQELFGFSDRLKISIPKVNQAIVILSEIAYIAVGGGFLKVLKWNEKQNDYLQRKSRGDYDKKKKYRRVSDKKTKYPLEERRGEEIKIEESKGAAVAATPQEIFEEWNREGKLPKCLVVSDKRRHLISARLKEPFFVSNWKPAIARLAKSPFCLGENNGGWKASFEWFLSPDAVTKIMEGKYDGASRCQNTKPNPRNAGIIVGPTDYGEAFRRKQERQRQQEEAVAGQVDSPKPSPPATTQP